MNDTQAPPPVARALKLAPSLLAADFARLGDELRAAEAGGADLIHVDVMDGHFVPNLSLGPLIVEACRRVTSLPLDVHLMISSPERYIGAFAEAGADIITVHAEATPHLHRALGLIRECGVQAGVALNPATPLTVLNEVLALVDLVLVMSVNPGFGGQTFIEGSLRRLRAARAIIDAQRPGCLLEVDGGINHETAPRAYHAGADVLVAGSAVFGGEGGVAHNLTALREAVQRADG
ncbi:ribulose-phosphate 3-epimerase [Truepera radiovictrix]|uniref:Ribulose-phosphate 3-epimerase n=1 Tax=Truepera radiovictrix (strain DSM 17093 / CIP 108686 / LMG 22925 / RQ-24) TaxID=649638 RepID=D7CVI7_TRURR|nr:ribulose-phosphate 3-epimerase [Truepera radiovictrix]ADI14215.1 ribulose-phosphate 3-epimerase [Truepera radiovictrix DSM 17093]WMT57227.1 ribulose-phosphate 3-epimerase [Truepera radiovictrix]